MYTGWSGDCGGMRVYVVRDEDEEVSELTQLLQDSVKFFHSCCQCLHQEMLSLSGVL